jgi:hypothetical protein
VPESFAYEVYMAIEDIKIYKSSGNAQIAAGDRIINYKIRNITNSIWNEEELPQQWKESIVVHFI